MCNRQLEQTWSHVSMGVQYMICFDVTVPLRSAVGALLSTPADSTVAPLCCVLRSNENFSFCMVLCASLKVSGDPAAIAVLKTAEKRLSVCILVLSLLHPRLQQVVGLVQVLGKS